MFKGSSGNRRVRITQDCPSRATFDERILADRDNRHRPDSHKQPTLVQGVVSHL